ncbi:MAG: MogA/MoaB family molybdenum cofactor biosynthesis protein [Candidatus Tyrphobacter sp.]
MAARVSGRFTAALIVLSDRAAAGTRRDECLPVMREGLGDAYEIVREIVIADDPSRLQAEIVDLADSCAASLVITSGGTGLSPRDRTPQATLAVVDYEVPGIGEAIRAASIPHVRTAMLSRAVAGVRNRTLVVNLPGSPSAVAESLAVIVSVLPHALELLA